MRVKVACPACNGAGVRYPPLGYVGTDDPLPTVLEPLRVGKTCGGCGGDGWFWAPRYEMYHRDCGTLLFYYDELPRAGDVLRHEPVTWPDGRRGEPCEEVRCPECGPVFIFRIRWRPEET